MITFIIIFILKNQKFSVIYTLLYNFYFKNKKFSVFDLIFIYF